MTSAQSGIRSKDVDDKRRRDTTAPADFETAIDAAGFGLFNVMLLLVAVFAAGASVFETSTMSYILPSAECDLKLSLLDKGVLNAVTYAGMITSAIAWGYIADTKGRKKILVWGYLVDVICIVGGALSQNVVQLMIFKYFGGFVLCGPFAVLMSYLTELHGKQYRARIMMLIGLKFTLASLTLPALALSILPQSRDLTLLGLTIHSWQVFLAISAFPSLLSGLLLSFFPESPKFLMSQGRNKEAMQSFRTIYAINKHKPKDTYPIKLLLEEVPEKHSKTVANAAEIASIEAAKEDGLKPQHTSATNTFRTGFIQLRPLFTKPYLGLSLQFYLMNFCILLGQNTVRLWLPQLFASITEYEHKSVGATSMCAILEYSVNKTSIVKSYDISSCEVVITAASYTNNIIVALAGLCGYILAGSVVNAIGSKRILNIGLAIAALSGISLYWSSSLVTTTIFSSLFVTMGSISSTSVISSSVNLFPTSLRTMIVSLAMMFGRCGSLLGNILFPTLMTLGCIPPFLMIGSVMLSACILSLFLPNSKKTSLK